TDALVAGVLCAPILAIVGDRPILLDREPLRARLRMREAPKRQSGDQPGCDPHSSPPLRTLDAWYGPGVVTGNDLYGTRGNSYPYAVREIPRAAERSWRSSTLTICAIPRSAFSGLSACASR